MREELVDSVSQSVVAAVCRVCEGQNLAFLYESTGSSAVTSAQNPLAIRVRVDFCPDCGHAQSPPLANVVEYYDTLYNFRNRDIEEDDIYDATADRLVFRAEHQASVLEGRLDLSKPMRILDYGCSKASTLRKLVQRHPSIVPYAFDVSEAYVDAWNQFIPSTNQATYHTPAAWSGQIDVVLSLFALEHVEEPRAFVQALRALLRPNGKVHVIVPHLYRNASDLLVADHINHFSSTSLRRLFRDAGFQDIKIDSESHRAALIVNATVDRGAADPKKSNLNEIAAIERSARAIAASWVTGATRVRAFEHDRRGRKTAIYGSGVYGLFIATTLTSLDGVAYFLDMNPYRQGLTLLNRPVIAPQAIEKDVEVVLVGLNPRDAKGIIDGSPWLHSVERDFIYL